MAETDAARKLPESSLADPAQDAAANAFAALYESHSVPMYNFVCMQLGDPAAAEDLAAEVWEKIYRALPRFDEGRGSFETWLYAITRNAIKDHFRRAPKERSRPLDEAEELPSTRPTPESELIAAEDESELLHALAALPPRMREILGLKFSAGMSNRSIAEATGLREGHIAVLLHRGIRRLRQDLTRRSEP